MNFKISIKLHEKVSNKTVFAMFIFIFYFCNEILYSFAARTIGTTFFYIGYNFIFFGCIILYALQYNHRGLIVSMACYCIIALLFLWTYLLHPEYEYWFFEPTYGIQIQFFRASGGIWAFLVISLISDRDELLKCLKVVAWLLFIFLTLRFIAAELRGYWVSYDADYSRVERDYNLGFGYSMLFPTVFFEAIAFLERKKHYYIPFFFGVLFILVGGSRGAILWVITAFPIMLPFRWKQMNKRGKAIAIFLVIIMIPIAYFLYVYYEILIQGFMMILSDVGFSSRTLTSLISGEISDDNGREHIYQMAIERIKTGGVFGNGVFGERILVGQKYRWGYAHNLFLEVYAAFGFLGGTIVSICLLIGIIMTYINCRTTRDQVIFLTFFICSLKLLLSDSFWFNREFWAMLAIIIMWRKEDIRLGVRKGLRIKKFYK